MKPASAEVWACVEPTVVGLGYELVGVEYGTAAEGRTLRVYIDQADGISLEDCARVSDQLSAVLDVADPISEAYRLEISSPGLDRPLFRESDYRRFLGAEVRLRTDVPVQGRRRFKGVLRAVGDGRVTLEVDGEPYEVPLAAVGEARLVPVL